MAVVVVVVVEGIDLLLGCDGTGDCSAGGVDLADGSSCTLSFGTLNNLFRSTGLIISINRPQIRARREVARIERTESPGVRYKRVITCDSFPFPCYRCPA